MSRMQSSKTSDQKLTSCEKKYSLTMGEVADLRLNSGGKAL